MKTKGITTAALLLLMSCSICHAELHFLKMLPGEKWWGLCNAFGREMPFSEKTDYEAELNYYDPCLHAMYVKCPVEISNVGLGDYVSPPSSITVFYNNLSVPRQIRYTQGATHGWWPKGMQSCVFTNALTAASVGQR